jgi:hypothetical protein
MRFLPDLLGVAGFAAVAYGAALLDPSAGWIIGGLGAIYVSYRLGRDA